MKNWKCKCKLDIVVVKQAEDCPVHPDPIPDARQEERENTLSALGEHPDSPVDIPQRVSDIRDEGRAHFHSLTQILDQLEKAKAEYDPKHLRTCDCHGCRRFRRAFTPNPDRPIYLQLDDEKKKVRELASEVCRLSASLSSEISRREHREPEKKKKQPLALNCTKCGSDIHSDSFHSERCPQGYR